LHSNEYMESLNFTLGAEGSNSLKQPSLLLSVYNENDRQLLKKFLPDFFTIDISENGIADDSFDLCILDHQSFEANKHKLLDLKKQAVPIFLPFLLLSPDQKAVRNSATVLEFADDVVYIPASKKLLQSRIRMLLRQRDYSLQLEEKNRQLEEKNKQLRIYKQAIDATNEGIVISDPSKEDHPIIFCNEGFQDLTGYDKDEVIGRNCRFLQNDDRNQQPIGQIRSFIESKVKGKAKLRNYRKDGTMFWNELSVAPITDGDGNTDYFVGVQRDITELVDTQLKLEEEKERYRLIAKNSTDMITRHDPDGTYLYVSPASEELLGYTPEELVGKNAFDIIHPDEREMFRKHIQDFRPNEVECWTFRKKLKSGTYRWVETTLRPIADEQTGKITEIQASTRDISARKEYERKLEEEKEFIDKSIESLPELFFLIDEDQNFVKWNNIERELGYTDDEIPEMQPLDFYKKEDQRLIGSKITEAFNTGHAEAEVQMQAKNGEMIPYFITTNVFTRGEKRFLVGSCVNLSEIKEAQYEVEQKRQLLDAIINQTKSLIYLKDSDRKYRLVNDSYLEFYDLNRDEVIGKTDREVHGSRIEKVRETDYKVLENREISEFEEVRSNKKESRFYHTIKYPLKGVPGFENCMCGISTDITDLQQATNQLQERIKEQRCLYNISSLPQKESTIEGLLQKAVNYLSKGLQYPDVTEAAITFGNEEYKTDGYRKTGWQMSAESDRIEDKKLMLNVVYTQEKPVADEGPFLKEERQLIDSVSDTLSSQLDQIISDKRLKESKNRWEKLVKNDPDLIMILVDREIKFVNQSGAQILGASSPAEITGEYLDDIVEADDMELVEKREKKLMDTSSLEPLVHSLEPVIHKVKAIDGKVRHIKTQSTPITYEGDQRAIQIVGQDVTGQIEYERELKESLKEKETLLQEIHHRVKNNLAVVSGMMDLQAFSTENEEVKGLLNDSKNRIKTMALIHEKLYQSASLSQIDFGSYVEDLLENVKGVSATNNKIEVELEYDSFNLNVNQAVPCALIINEVVANAFEHAFTDQESGVIEVSLRNIDHKIVIDICDNGRGLPSDFEFRKSKSIGMTIIETLIKQLEAEQEIENENGLSFTFSFEKRDIKGSSSTLV